MKTTPVLGPEPRTQFSTWLAWSALGVLLGVEIMQVRCRLLAKLGQVTHMPAPDWAAVGWIGEELPICLAFGVAGAVVGGLVLHGRPVSLARLLAACAALMGAFTLGVSGVGWSPPFHQSAFYSVLSLWLPLGYAVTALLGTGSLAVITLRPPGPWVRAAGFLLVSVAIAWAFPWAYARAYDAGPPTMTLREVKRDLLLGERWTVLDQHPASEPRPEILRPDKLSVGDGAAWPALITSPPCRVTFEVPRGDGRVGLRTGVAVDSGDPADEGQVGFEITRNGEVIYTETIDLEEDPEASRNASDRNHWKRPSQISFEGGDVIGLRTYLVDVPDEEAKQRDPVKAGFGELLLEQTSELPRSRPTSERPNIVVILEDTFRADRMSSYGYPKNTTPNLDRLAARGLRYSDCHASASWTWPSTASILTGLEPEAHGVLSDADCYLSESCETLAEALQRAGYTTGGFSANSLIAHQKNFDQGFETFDDDAQRFRETEELIGSINRWIGVNAGAKFFLYLHLVDPHAPHKPLPDKRSEFAPDAPGPDEVQKVQGWLTDYQRQLNRGRGRTRRGEPKPWPFEQQHLEWFNELYDACVSSADERAESVLERLRHFGLEDRTVVVFTSDHGEEWYDHGALMHGQALHRELTRVPLIIAGPGIEAGVEIGTRVANRQLAPTLARLGGAELQGLPDPVDLLRIDELPTVPLFLSTHNGWTGKTRQRLYGVRTDRWLLHFAPEGNYWTGVVPGGWVRLYDLQADPGELVDVSEQHPEVAEQLRAQILEHIQQNTALRANPGLEAGEDTLDMLRAMGYLTDE